MHRQPQTRCLRIRVAYSLLLAREHTEAHRPTDRHADGRTETHTTLRFIENFFLNQQQQIQPGQTDRQTVRQRNKVFHAEVCLPRQVAEDSRQTETQTQTDRRTQTDVPCYSLLRFSSSTRSSRSQLLATLYLRSRFNQDTETNTQADRYRDKPVVDMARDVQCRVHTRPQLAWKNNCSVYQLSIHSSHARTVRHWLYH